MVSAASGYPDSSWTLGLGNGVRSEVAQRGSWRVAGSNGCDRERLTAELAKNSLIKKTVDEGEWQGRTTKPISMRSVGALIRGEISGQKSEQPGLKARRRARCIGVRDGVVGRNSYRRLVRLDEPRVAIFEVVEQLLIFVRAHV